MKKKVIHVLLLEDNPGDARLFQEYLREVNLVQVAVEHVERLKAALERLARGKPDLILLDLGLPDSQGLETFTEVHARAPEVPIVVLSGLADADQAVEAVRDGAQDFLAKGEVTGTLLARAIRYAIERKRTEEALRESEERFSILASATFEGIAISDKGRIMDANPQLADMMGYDPGELLGLSPLNFVASQSRDLVMANISAGFEGPYEHLAQKKDGTIFPVEVRARKIHYKGRLAGVTIIRDISERKQAEKKLKEYSEHLEEMVAARTRELREAQEKLVRREKLAVLGQLAGSVSHELRNPLSVINSSIYYLKLAQPEAGEKIKEHHAMIEQEVHNAEKIIGDLLDFARVVSSDRKPVAIPELMQSVLERVPASASVDVKLEIPSDLPMVYVDPRQMEQVLGNLVVNACQAMPDGGKLIISARVQKEIIALAVKDTGTGITPENMKKLFEPLFSTKAKGIGLGLAVSKKLAEANDGWIDVENDPGKGTTFTLWLPSYSPQNNGAST